MYSEPKGTRHDLHHPGKHPETEPSPGKGMTRKADRMLLATSEVAQHSVSSSVKIVCGDPILN